MMIVIVEKFLNLLAKFRRNSRSLLFSFNRKGKNAHRMFFTPLACAAFWFSTRAACQTKTTFHKVRELSKKPFFTGRWSQIYLLCYSRYTENIATDMCLSRGCVGILNFYSGCQEKCWFFKREVLSSPATVLGGG